MPEPGPPPLATDSKPPSILIVDDEQMVLSSLEALFHLETDYRITCCRDPLGACEQLNRAPVDAIISDFLMPGLNGIDLLKEARRIQPDAARILLTAFADRDNAIRGINEAGLFHFLEKPWDNQQMLIIVRNAFQEKNLRLQLSQKVKELAQLAWEHKELVEHHSYLERELEMAARVQRALLPSLLPVIEKFRVDSFYKPCLSLGGDFYDFVADPGLVRLLVSDVSGHGTQAALTSMLLKASFRDAAGKSSSPAELLAEMNATLHRYLPAGMFVAATALYLYEGWPSVQLSNAGLPYPFVLRHSDRRVDEIPLGGIPLGIFEGRGLESYDLREVPMARGDVLLIASDGLGDICNDAEQHYGDQELRSTLTELSGGTGGEIIGCLMERAAYFGGSRPMPDDVTILTVTTQ